MSSLPPPERFQKLSIFFPMWNEEAYIIHRAIGSAKEICGQLVTSEEIRDYELIVLNDASTDKTGQLADAIAAEDRHVKVVHHPINRKLGGSIKTGFGAATGDLVLYSDADLPFEMLEVLRAVRVIRNYDADMSVPTVWTAPGRARGARSTRGSTTGSFSLFSGATCAISTSHSSCAAAGCWTIFRSSARDRS